MTDLILKKLETIENKLLNIENAINDINNKLDTSIVNNCEKMGHHVDFIEGVYDIVRKPLEYVSNKLSNNTHELPFINSTKNQIED